MTGQPVAKHLVIHGRVQGVWFRDWTVKTATELDLTGWVRNRRDGTVEALVQGEAAAVDRYIDLSHAGPPAADVTRIEAEDVTPEDFDRFAKRSTR